MNCISDESYNSVNSLIEDAKNHTTNYKSYDLYDQAILDTGVNLITNCVINVYHEKGDKTLIHIEDGFLLVDKLHINFYAEGWPTIRGKEESK